MPAIPSMIMICDYHEGFNSCATDTHFFLFFFLFFFFGFSHSPTPCIIRNSFIHSALSSIHLLTSYHLSSFSSSLFTSLMLLMTHPMLTVRPSL
ncbi:hypothetical protein BJ165DRAFT_264463 [Panaeolus papilionaceus]|nr:hypothetical protein BJ165DRAFT_264463 [Panaeolus papilionaceus]